MHLLHAYLFVGFAAIVWNCTKAESVVTPNKRTSVAAGLEATNNVLAGHAQRVAADGDAARRRSSHHSQRSIGQEQVQFASAVDIAVDVSAMPAAIGCCAFIHTCHALPSAGHACPLCCGIGQSCCLIDYRPKHGAKRCRYGEDFFGTKRFGPATFGRYANFSKTIGDYSKDPLATNE